MTANKSGGGRSAAKQTSAPIGPGEIGSAAEFGRVRDVEKIFALKRGKLYQLIGTGQIKSAVILQKGAKRGLRLIHLDSVRQLLAANTR
jgi:hypothetical protein